MNKASSSNKDMEMMDALSAYLSEIGKYPVLSPEEEYALAIRVKNGADIAAKNLLIEHNLKLVVSVVRRLCNTGDEFAFAEMIAAGNEGLMRAVEKFDPEMGYKFSTYASWWIRQAAMRYKAENGRTVRLPVYISELIAKERKARQALENELGRKPTPEEVAEYLQITVDKLMEITICQKDIVSLETNVGEEKETKLGDMIKDSHMVSPEEEAIGTEMKREVKKLVNNSRLSEKERYVINRRFGLVGKQATLEEIGNEMRRSRERIRQIERNALRKLEVVARKKNLQEFIA